jgi:hypothetical protein
MMVYAVNDQHGQGVGAACKGPSHKKEGVRHTGQVIQNRQLRDGAISSQGDKLPTGQYLGEKG